MTLAWTLLKPFIEALDASGGVLKIENKPWMDLYTEFTLDTKKFGIIALGHYYEQNGDRCADPDMEVYFDRETQEVRPISCTQGGGRFYKAVSSRDPDKQTAEDRLVAANLRDFLDLWLTNLAEQGFIQKAEEIKRALCKPTR